MTRIGLISDVHAAPAPLKDALAIFRENRVDTILCAGDVAGYRNALEDTVSLLVDNGCQSVIGNHDLWHLEDNEDTLRDPAADYLCRLPEKLEMTAEGSTLCMVHASPSGSLLDGIRLLDEKGNILSRQAIHWAEALGDFPADILVVGHTHQVYAEQLGGRLVINPGSSLFNHTCAILTLPDRRVEFYPLLGKKPVLSWNFSMFRDMIW